MNRKITYYIVIGLLLFTSKLQAQEYQYVPFPDSGAVWSEVYSPARGECDTVVQIYERFALSGEDTLINNFTYKKLYIFYDSIFDKNNATSIGGIREDSLKRIYYSGNIVRESKPLKIENPEILLFDFAVNIGDTIWNGNTNIDRKLIVEDIDTIHVGNSLRKKFFFNYNWVEWTEGIGSNSGLLFAAKDFLIGSSSSNSLICFFQNDSVLFHSEYYNDCFPSTVSVESEKLKHNITVYPNPTNGNTVRFEWGNSEIENIEVFNLLGELVDSKIVTNKSFVDYPTNKMQPGIYVYKAIDKNGFYQTGRFVVE